MSDHIERLCRFVSEWAGDRQSLRLLEAGCGSCSWLDLGGRAQVVGIDISEKQLRRNELIHEAIVGDITTYAFEPGDFDMICCIDVLEHVDRPQSALANLHRALAPGGLLVLKIPNVMSWKGLLTKFTPHGLHVWVYRKFLGRPNAGCDDIGPFKTFLRLSIRPGALLRWGKSRSLKPVYQEYYQSSAQVRLRRTLGPLDLVARLFEGVTRVLSLGRLSLTRTEYIIVFKRPGVSADLARTGKSSIAESAEEKALRALKSSG